MLISYIISAGGPKDPLIIHPSFLSGQIYNLKINLTLYNLKVNSPNIILRGI